MLATQYKGGNIKLTEKSKSCRTKLRNDYRIIIDKISIFKAMNECLLLTDVPRSCNETFSCTLACVTFCYY